MAAITIWDIIKNNISRKVDFIFFYLITFFFNIHVLHHIHATSIYFLHTASTFAIQDVLYITSTDAMQ